MPNRIIDITSNHLEFKEETLSGKQHGISFQHEVLAAVAPFDCVVTKAGKKFSLKKGDKIFQTKHGEVFAEADEAKDSAQKQSEKDKKEGKKTIEKVHG